jgi:endo-1,4-beta-xylanase
MNTLAHRTGAVDVTVSGPGGVMANSAVSVRQVRHSFGFGNIGFELMDVATGHSTDMALADSWLSLFNQATLAFYWRGFERTEGSPETASLTAAAAWFAERGVPLKGHPLLWHTLAPEWLLGRSLSDVEATVRSRITREVAGFAGIIDEWDAINEAVIMPRFTAETNAITPLAQSLGRVGMVKLAVETSRAANPAARLVVNDFLLTDEYAHLLEECLEAGIDFDAIGLQTHMHQGFRGEDELGAILERFGAFGLPLQLTETTLVSGDLMPGHIVDLNDYQVEHWPSTPEGEERQADELSRHYRMCLAHPLVESITYWGLCDRSMWLGAPAGLLRADGSPKPSFDALHSLIKGDWWMPPTEAATTAHGGLTVSGWGGEYEISAGGLTGAVSIVPGAHTSAEVTLS